MPRLPSASSDMPRLSRLQIQIRIGFTTSGVATHTKSTVAHEMDPSTSTQYHASLMYLQVRNAPGSLQVYQGADRAAAAPGWLASLVASRPAPGMVWKLPRCRLRGDTGGRPGRAAVVRWSCAVPVRRCSRARIFESKAFKPAGPFDTDASRAGSIAATPTAPWRPLLAVLPAASWV